MEQSEMSQSSSRGQQCCQASRWACLWLVVWAAFACRGEHHRRVVFTQKEGGGKKAVA